jgi:ATP-dependent DNA helicase RecQ
MDLPDSLEAYYQEAGRAGRDEKTAYAIVLYNKNDIADLKARPETSYPPPRVLKSIYQALANYLQVPVEGGFGVSYDFDVSRFIASYDFNPVTVVSALRHFSAEGLISVTDAVFLPSRVHFRIPHNQLYNFQATHPRFDPLIKTLLRSSEGIFDDFVRINESELANRTNMTYDQVVSMFRFLHQADVIHYEPRKDAPQLVFTSPREDADYLTFDEKKYAARKALYLEQTEAVARYVTSRHYCRSMMLLDYFGEHPDARCGHCDYCRSRNKVDMNEIEIGSFREKVLQFLGEGPATPMSVLEHTGARNHEKGLDALAWMVDLEIIRYTASGMLETVPGTRGN